MFKHSMLRQLSRASTTAVRPPTAAAVSRQITRGIRITPAAQEKKDGPPKDKHDAYSTSGKPGAFEHEGQFSRTDKTIRVEYPEEEDLPSSAPVQGRGGYHFKRTLATFSLEDRVGVVTGGARGLGLVMSQALVVSGAQVAIVDLNSKAAYMFENRRQTLTVTQRMRARDKPRSSWRLSVARTQVPPRCPK
jgi:D-arabinose 1-dehydrogenase-like Zn-dependent alcohol dehydrogenase